MRGLNIEFEAHWLELNELRDHDLGDYSLLDSAQAALGALRLLVYAVQPGVQHDADLETQALELLEPLVSRPRHSDCRGEPRWLRSAEAFLRARFRESVSLRDAARGGGAPGPSGTRLPAATRLPCEQIPPKSAPCRGESAGDGWRITGAGLPGCRLRRPASFFAKLFRRGWSIPEETVAGPGFPAQLIQVCSPDAIRRAQAQACCRERHIDHHSPDGC